MRLLARPAERASLGRAARELHGRVFGLDRTLAVLLRGHGQKSAAVA